MPRVLGCALVPVNNDHTLHLVQQAAGEAVHSASSSFHRWRERGSETGSPLSNVTHRLSQGSNPGLCGAWIEFSTERVGDGERGGVRWGAQGGKERWETSPALSPASLCASVSFWSRWTRRLALCLSLCLCVTHCSGRSMGSTPLAAGRMKPRI